MNQHPRLLGSLLFLVLGSGCAAGIRLADLETPMPIPETSCLILGFVGGRESWDEEDQGVRRLALRLGAPRRSRFSETFENQSKDVAEEFVLRALDRDGDGSVDEEEALKVTLVVYGQSFGGAATVQFSQRLQARGIPVTLTVQVDSVGLDDGVIPKNVRFAANFYQDDGLLIEGEHPVRARDPSATRILGNWSLDYGTPPGSEIDISDLPWYKILFRVAHARMDRDPRVWTRVHRLIEAACAGEDLEAVAAGMAPR